MFQDVIEDGPADLGGIKPGQLLLARDGVPISPTTSPLFGLDRQWSTQKLCLSVSERIKYQLSGLSSLRPMSYLCPDRWPIGYSLTKRHIQKGTKPENLPKISDLPASKLRQVAMFLRFRFIHKDRSLALATEGLGHVHSTVE
jgi:hypothetical protein